MLKLRTDTQYVTDDGKLTLAGREAIQGLFDGQAAQIATLEAADATEAANAPGSAPRYSCRAWVNFNGTGTVAIRASGNIASVVDQGTGYYEIVFTAAMPDTSYAILATCSKETDASATARIVTVIQDTIATTGFRIHAQTQNGTYLDMETISIAVFR